eukprot:762272_1
MGRAVRHAIYNLAYLRMSRSPWRNALAAVQADQPAILEEARLQIVGEPVVRAVHSGSHGLLDRECDRRRAADHRDPLSMLSGLLQAAVNSVHPEGSTMFFHTHAVSEALPMSTRFGDFFLTVGGEMHLVTVLIGQCGHVEAGGKYLQSHQEHVRGNAGAAASRPSKNK